MRPSLEMSLNPLLSDMTVTPPSVPEAPEASEASEVSGSRVNRSLECIRQLAGRAALSVAISLGIVAGETVASEPAAAIADAPYPDANAVDCSARYGVYSWCKNGNWISPRGYGYRNCTDWAAFRSGQLTGKAVPRGWGNAKEWDNNAARAGYIVDSIPNVGDIAVWDGGSYGHVEVVEGVNADGSVNTSGYNKRRDGTYGMQSATRADHYIQMGSIGNPSGGATPNYPETIPPPVMYGKGDLYFIKTSNTPSGNVEVHSATKGSEYQQSDLHQATRFSVADAANGTFQMVGRKLYFIKTAATGSGRVEIHTATETSHYQTADLALATPFAVTDGQNGTWHIADINHDQFVDLVFIKTAATASGKVEVFAANGGPNHFGSLSLAKASAFALEESRNGSFQIQNADLVFIKTKATASGMVEFFRAPIGSDFGVISEATPTAFNAAEDANGIFSSVDTNGDHGAELVFVKTRNTGSGTIEAFAAAGINYQDVILAKPTNITVQEGGSGLFQVDNKE